MHRLIILSILCIVFSHSGAKKCPPLGYKIRIVVQRLLLHLEITFLRVFTQVVWLINSEKHKLDLGFDYQGSYNTKITLIWLELA